MVVFPNITTITGSEKGRVQTSNTHNQGLCRQAQTGLPWPVGRSEGRAISATPPRGRNLDNGRSLPALPVRKVTDITHGSTSRHPLSEASKRVLVPADKESHLPRVRHYHIAYSHCMEIPTVSHVLRLLIKGPDRGSSAILAVFAAEDAPVCRQSCGALLRPSHPGGLKRGLPSTRA
jgi:hypothetical protein